MRDDEVWGQGISGASWEGGPRLGMEFLGWGGKCLTGFFRGEAKGFTTKGHEGYEGKLTREGPTGGAEGNHSLIATPLNRTERVCAGHRRVPSAVMWATHLSLW